MKKTLEELLEIDQIVGKLYRENPNLPKGKFGYAYNKFYKKNIKPTEEKRHEELEDLYVKNASVDESTKIIRINKSNPRGFDFGKLELQNVLLEERKIWDKYKIIEIEIEPYFCEDVPEMDLYSKEILTGVLIK